MRIDAVLMAALLTIAPALAPGSSELSAQDRPDFSGTWTRAGAAAAAGAGMAGLGQSATITQSDSTLTLVRTSQLGERRSVYNLDGSNRANTLAMGDFSMPQRTTATWNDAGALVIRTTTDFNGTSIETTLTLSMEADGRLKAVATSPGLGGGAATEETAFYTKG